jgi:hypothetical protein
MVVKRKATVVGLMAWWRCCWSLAGDLCCSVALWNGVDFGALSRERYRVAGLCYIAPIESESDCFKYL